MLRVNTLVLLIDIFSFWTESTSCILVHLYIIKLFSCLNPKQPKRKLLMLPSHPPKFVIFELQVWAFAAFEPQLFHECLFLTITFCGCLSFNIFHSLIVTYRKAYGIYSKHSIQYLDASCSVYIISCVCCWLFGVTEKWHWRLLLFCIWIIAQTLLKCVHRHINTSKSYNIKPLQ